jgi:hypothetical protein
LISDNRSCRAIDAAEAWADGIITTAQLKAVQLQAEAACDEYTSAPQARFGDATSNALSATVAVARPNKAWVWTVANLMRAASSPAPEYNRDALIQAELVQVQFLRDIFNNPFRRIQAPRIWKGDTVTHLAHDIYENRTFAGLPILADALEEAGCDNNDILSHCRSGGVHVRGCWVVDLILGRR